MQKLWCIFWHGNKNIMWRNNLGHIFAGSMWQRMSMSWYGTALVMSILKNLQCYDSLHFTEINHTTSCSKNYTNLLAELWRNERFGNQWHDKMGGGVNSRILCQIRNYAFLIMINKSTHQKHACPSSTDKSIKGHMFQKQKWKKKRFDFH